MKKSILLFVCNTTTLLFTLIMNGLAGSGFFGGKTVGSVSAKYNTLIAPAGYAFAIWGFIYLLLILFVAFQWYSVFRKKNRSEIQQTGVWFSVANIANGLWIIAWLNELLLISVVLILLLLVCLIVLTVKLRLEIPNASRQMVVFVWWPIAFYLGWIIIASVANTAVYLVGLGWDGGILPAHVWTVLMLAVATFIYAALVFTRHLRETALVGIWAFIAIAIRQWGVYESIAYTAILGAVILLISININAYKNRHHLTFLPKR